MLAMSKDLLSRRPALPSFKVPCVWKRAHVWELAKRDDSLAAIPDRPLFLGMSLPLKQFK